jgi:penicillin V acylase-like amidase (Ntn superfamily)
MSKKSTTKTSPERVAARVLLKYLSAQELYGEVLDEVSEQDFVAMENSIIGNRTIDLALTTEDAERQMARQEACFLLGLALGKRLAGAR